MNDDSLNILGNIDDHISSPSTEMLSKKFLYCFHTLRSAVGSITVWKGSRLSGTGRSFGL